MSMICFYTRKDYKKETIIQFEIYFETILYIYVSI